MDPYQLPEDRDSDNPYAPPRSALVPEAPPELTAGLPFTVNDVFNWSWAIFKVRMSTCLRIVWGIVGINWAISIAMNFCLRALEDAVRDPTLFRLLYIWTIFSSIVIQVWLVWVGQTIAMLKIARGEPVAIEDVFKGGRFVLTTILATIVFFLAIAVPIGVAVGVIILGMVMMQDQVGVAAIILFLVGSVLAGVLVIILTARLSMYSYIIIDQNAGVLDSLSRSWRLTRGQVGTLTCVYFMQVAVVLAGLLAFCVGLVFAIPLASLYLPVTYLALTRTATAQAEKPELVWDDDR